MHAERLQSHANAHCQEKMFAFKRDSLKYAPHASRQEFRILHGQELPFSHLTCQVQHIMMNSSPFEIAGQSCGGECNGHTGRTHIDQVHVCIYMPRHWGAIALAPIHAHFPILVGSHL